MFYEYFLINYFSTFLIEIFYKNTQNKKIITNTNLIGVKYEF